MRRLRPAPVGATVGVTGGGARAPAGVALPVVLLLLLALTALAHGMGTLATAEGRAARAAANFERARVVAHGVAHRELAALAADSLPVLPLREPTPVGAASFGSARAEASLERVDREWHLLEVRAQGASGAPWWRGAWPIWALDPAVRFAAARAVLERGGPLSLGAGTAVDGGALWSADGGSCEAFRPAVDSLLSSGRLPAVILEAGESPRLGLLDLPTLLRRLPPLEDPVLSPAPVVAGGTCATGVARNWGSPREPDGPCGSHRRARGAAGDLRLEGGEAQGVLVVGGSLRIAAGALFAGVLVVGDSLVLEEGARVAGLAVVGGAVTLGAGARIDGRTCPAVLALSTAKALREPVPAPGPAPLRIH